MYHPLTHMVPRLFLYLSFRELPLFILEGKVVCLLKSNFLSSDVYADILGLLLGYLNKFNVNLHCLIRRKNKCIGKFGSMLQIPAMKWVFQVLIDLSDAFIICTHGCISCNLLESDSGIYSLVLIVIL